MPQATRRAAPRGRSDPTLTKIPARRAWLGRCATAALAIACIVVSAGCMKMPSLKRGAKSGAESGTHQQPSSLTPRELLGAKLINGRADADTPPITVGKLVELADRYLACDCAGTRFAKAWTRTPRGYRLVANSQSIGPLDFVCADHEESLQCFLREIDRGPTEALDKRFVPGAEFIRLIYENGVQCNPEKPCP